MLPYRALWSNTQFAFEVLSLKPGDRIVSMLPMAHMYGLAFEFLYEVCLRMPCVLPHPNAQPEDHIRSIFRSQASYRHCSSADYRKNHQKESASHAGNSQDEDPAEGANHQRQDQGCVREHMIQAFGGNFYEIIIGRAAFNQECRKTAEKSGLPLYRRNRYNKKCGPIICYEDWHNFKPGSCGKAPPRMEVRIDSPDPANIVGEILTRGDNVMQGYYKNPRLPGRPSTKTDGYTRRPGYHGC